MTAKEYEQLAKRLGKVEPMINQLNKLRQMLDRTGKLKGDEDISVDIRIAKDGDHVERVQLASKGGGDVIGAVKENLVVASAAILKGEIERRQAELAKL